MVDLVIGFDLDMTVVDSRPGIAATYRALAARTGAPIDADIAVSRLGPPLQWELAQWVPEDQVPVLVDKFRELYPEHAVAPSLLLPGAAEAVAAVRGQRGKVVVVTAKHPRLARLHLDHTGVEVDEVVGLAWADGKATALREHGAAIYVGDHTADVAAAKAAGVVSVAVATGSCGADELRAAGADVVLADLTEFPAWLAEHLLRVRLADLDARLREHDGLMVAFSGGADSAFLLAAAVRALGPDRVVAATAISPSLPVAELDAARDFAVGLGVRHMTPRTDEMSRDGYRANAGDRCYFCKAELLDVLGPVAAELAVPVIATGTNADDAVAGFRPGIRAAAERGAVTPLRDAGLTKAQIRRASRDWGLSTWDKPAAACLSSRVAYGIEISPSRLARVERAETALREAFATAGVPIRNLRVRDMGPEGARVEVDRDLVDVVAAKPELLAAVAGFDAVQLDPRGFRSGAMNELLPEPDRYR